MNYFDLYSSYPDRTIAAAWDSRVREADKTPWLTDALTGCGDELFTRFAACYAELSALPRGARRALQRQLARSSELAATLPEFLQQGGRRLQHRMAWSLAGAALLLALGQGVATAATITVTRNDPRIIPDGQCSLVEAIVNANNDAATHADCPAGSGADTIVLPANANVMLSNVYCSSNTYGPFCRPVGLPPITSRITIEGNGALIARQGGAPAFGLIDVGGDLTLRRVTLSGGSVGGLSNGGTTNIEYSVISGNRGGGVSNYGTLTIANSTISGNANSGLWNSGTLGISGSTISNNTSNFWGGGLSNFGTLTIENSTISSNRADQGGGISNSGGRLTITNSTISSNRANRAGGVSNSQYYCYYSFCTEPGTLGINNSLIAGNQAAVAPEIENDASSMVIANNFNLFGANGNAGVSGFTPGPADVVPSVPLAQILGPLQNNGGPTQTHVLLAGSPALDAGNPGGCLNSQGALLSTDQRGFARHVDGNNDGTGRCDIGAVELNRHDNIGMALNVSPSSGSGSFQTFRFTFFDPNAFADLFSGQLLIHSSLTAAGGCYLYYHRESNSVWLQDDSGSGWIGPSLLGSGPALQNSQCAVGVGSSSAFGSGSNLTLNLALAFTSAFSGSKNIYALAHDNQGLTSDWQQEGTWTVPGGNQPPAVLSLTPSSGSGSSQTFSFGFFDPNGFTNVFSAQLLIHSTLAVPGSCYLYYHRESNAVWLQDGSGWIGPSLLGSGPALQNGQCTLDVASSSAVGSGSNLTLNLDLGFTPAFSGSRNVYAFAYDNEGFTSNWQQAGMWTVP